jgi:glycosyltransferase involved in cell wall biosynthesis
VHVTASPLTQWWFLRGQTPFMIERGFDVHCVASPGEHLDKIAPRDGATIHPLPIARSIAPLSDLRSLVALWRLFRALRPDIVHASSSKGSLLAVLAARLAGVPIRIYHIRGLASEDARGWQRTLFTLLERVTARLSNAWFVNAPSLLDHTRAVHILGRRQGVVFGRGMANGIDVRRFDPDSGSVPQIPAGRHRPLDRASEAVIGFIGRLTADKGIDELAEAWARIRDSHPATRLLLVGPWEPEDPVDPANQAALESDDRVIILPHQDDVVPFYRLIDVFVYPSRGGEGFPNAPMEAAAMRLPVIVTRVVGSVDAVVDGGTGVIVEPRDADGLAAAIRGYLDDPDRRREHGQAGRLRVERDFRSEVIWPAVFDEYVRLLQVHGRPLPTGVPDTAAVA